MLAVQEGLVGKEPAIAFPLPSGGYKVCLYNRPDPEREKPYSFRFTDGGMVDLLLFGDDRDVLLCAGEWDALAALSVGFESVATGTGGENKWEPEWAERFKGKRVFVIYDADEVGQSGARKAADSLAAHGVEVYIVDLSLSGNERDGKDLSDYLALYEPEQLRDLLKETIKGGWHVPKGPPTDGQSTNVDTALIASTAYSPHGSSPWPNTLGEAAYHGIAGEFVRVVEPHTEADPVALLVQHLVGFGSLIGRGAHFVAEADRHYTNLFTVLVGQTAKGRKGTSKGHVDQILRGVDEAWERNHQQSGLSSGEGLIWAVRDPIKGQERLTKSGRVSYEEVEKDPGISDKRLLVYESEFAQPLRAIGRDGNILSPLIRRAWDVGDLQAMTKNSPAKATGAHVSIIGHITRDEVRRYLDRTEMGNGFANRFLWIGVKRSRLLPDGGNLDLKDLAPIIKTLSDAVRFARQLGNQEFKRDKTAGELWHEVYPRLSEGRPGLFGAVISRAEAQVMRLALIYALLDRSEHISRSHLEAAWEIWRYAEDSARYIFGDAIGDPLADELLALLRANPQGLTRTEIREHFKRNRRSNQISRALGILQEHGLARCVQEETGGRPAERWYAVTCTR